MFAENRFGVHYTNAIEFKTLAGAPATLVANLLLGVAPTSMTINTTVIANTEAPTLERGVAWFPTNEAPSGFHEGWYQQRPNTAGGLQESILPKGTLSTGTLYYFRAYARSRFGLFFSNALEGSTSSGEVELSLSNAVVTSTTSLTFKGNVISNGGTAVWERGAVIGTAIDGGDSDTYLATSVGVGEYNVFIDGLDRNTTYYIHAYAKNEYGEYYSDDFLTVTTMSGIPTFDVVDVFDIGGRTQQL